MRRADEIEAIFWRPELLVDVVCLIPPPPPWADAPRVLFDPWRWPGRKHLLIAEDGVHIVATGSPAGSLRLWLPRRSSVPPLGTELGFYVHPDGFGQERAEAALRFWRLAADPPVSRRPPGPLAWPRHDPLRLGLMLWALDLKRSGMSRREIARVMLGVEPGADWSESDARSWVRRLMRDAEKLVSGGYRDLLRPLKRRLGRS